MTNYNDGKWHGWNGGECPVHPKSVVEVVSWAGCKRCVEAGLIRSWADDGAQSQPVAFRVVKEHKGPLEWCINPQGKSIWYDARDGMIHVKDVLEPKKPREFWLSNGIAGTYYVHNDDPKCIGIYGAIHVREVL